MIILDTDGEAFIRESGFDLAIPIHVEQNGDETKIFAYPFAEKLCTEYEKRFADDLFSDEALDFLRDGCAGFCRELGYHEEKHPKNWGYNFIASDMSADPNSVCERIRRDKYRNLTTFDIQECLAYDRVIYAVVKEGQIVSVAVTCEGVQNDGEIVEIGTETAVGHRKNGYAAAAVRALTAYLCENGHKVLYKCHHENAASAAVASSVGFAPYGRFYYYVLRKD